MIIELKCAPLLLQPRNFIFKRKQKKRRFWAFNNCQKKLNFGGFGLLLLKPIYLTSNQLFRFKLFLKRAAKQSDKTRRFVWFFAFPHLPLTRKPEGVRMGKGKGKLECWCTTISGGAVLIEFKNLRYGRAAYYIKQMTFKLGIPTKMLRSTSQFFSFPLKTSKKVALTLFW